MELGVQLLRMVRLDSVPAERFWSAAAREATPVRRMNAVLEEPKTALSRALLLGALLTALQVVVAVFLIAPGGPADWRYNTLVQHDSYWFGNIVTRGYGTILPPIQQKLMEVSNVAFFPAYPAFAGALHHWLGLRTERALLLAAQLAAFGFWTYFFLISARWRVSGALQVAGACAILAHPTAFFLVAGYSESLFLMALFGFVYWTGAEGKAAKVLAILHGFVMSATRIVGIPCAAYPVVRRLFLNPWSRIKDVRLWVRDYAWPVALMVAATMGGVSFFLYCLIRWGRWDLYMLTQKAGWDIKPDYLAIFKPGSYHWMLPPLDDPTQWSQLTMTLGALVFVLVALAEGLAALRLRTQWQARIGLYFTAFITYYIAVSGVASVRMESMLRYQFCAHALIVLAMMHFLAQLPRPSLPWRALGVAVIALLCAAGLGLQGWWIWNFTRGGWVA